MGDGRWRTRGRRRRCLTIPAAFGSALAVPLVALLQHLYLPATCGPLQYIFPRCVRGRRTPSPLQVFIGGLAVNARCAALTKDIDATVAAASIVVRASSLS